MRFIYDILLALTIGLLRLYSALSPKLRAFFAQRSTLWTRIEAYAAAEDKRPVLWIHVASLGEFEQMRPLLARLKEEHGASLRLLVSFFSPSGYRVRAAYEGVDGVMYLPLDRVFSMRRFMRVLQPMTAIIAKNELWPNMCYEALRKGVRLVSVGGRFSLKQLYFRPMMGFLRGMLKGFELHLTQDVHSAKLLRKVGCKQVEVVGDLRFEGVQAASLEPADFPIIEHFRAQKGSLMIWGSIWPDEWNACAQAIEASTEWLHIVAPHELSESFLSRIEERFHGQILRYSDYEKIQTSDKARIEAARCLLIDNVGLLARLYRYAELAYVGGGRHGALHNILEPAVYGVPVIFWKHKAHGKFPEAEALRQWGAAASIGHFKELIATMQLWQRDPQQRKQAGNNAAQYVAAHLGSIERIMNQLAQHQLLVPRQKFFNQFIKNTSTSITDGLKKS